jgi:hypothetical protein
VPEDPDTVSQATAAFLEPQCPIYLQEPSSNPSANEAGEAADIVVFEDLGHNAMETMTAAGNEPVSLFNASLEHITKEIDDFYSLCEEMDVRPLPLVDSFIIMDGSNFEVRFEVPSSPQPPPPGATSNNAADTSSTLVDGSRATSFKAWTRSSQSCSDEAVAVPVIEEPQKLLKKVVAGGGATRTNWNSAGNKWHQESRHVRAKAPGEAQRDVPHSQVVGSVHSKGNEDICHQFF